MSTVYSRPQLSPSELRCSPHTTYYTNFFVLRTAVTINGQAAEIGFDEKKQLTLNCRYPSTNYLSLTLSSVLSGWEVVLNKYGVSHISNFWCEEVPFFQVGFSSEHSLSAFLHSRQRMEIDLASVLAESASVLVEDMSCGVETELFLVAPDVERKNAQITRVTDNNYSSCQAVWKESEVFEFGSTFRAYLTSPGQPTAVTEGLSLKLLNSELSDVVDWFHLGLYLGVPPSELLKTEAYYHGERRKTVMLNWWVDNEEQPTWSAVVRALEGIRMRGLAQKIAVKYAVPHSSVSTATDPHPTHITAAGSQTVPVQLPANIQQLYNSLEERDEELTRISESLLAANKSKMFANGTYIETKKKLTAAQASKKRLAVERDAARKQLELKEGELRFLKRLQKIEKKNDELQAIITKKEDEISRLRRQLVDTELELSQAKEEIHQLRKQLQPTTVELAEKSTQVREMERVRADVERKRCQADMMIMQLCAMKQGVKSPLERVSPGEVDTLNQAVKEKAEEVGRLSSQLEGKETEKKMLALEDRQSEDQLVEVTAEVCELMVNLVEEEDRRMRAMVELEDLKSRRSVVNPLPPDPQCCKAVGCGLQHSEINQIAQFQVHLTDTNGEPCIERQEVCAELRSLVSGRITQAKVLHQTSSVGSYEVSYQPSVRGRHELSVSVNGEAIADSPFSVYVQQLPQQMSQPVKVIRELSKPWRVTVNSSGQLIVTGADGISIFDSQGELVRRIQHPAGRKHPSGVAIDDSGTMYVCDDHAHMLFKVSSTGEVLKSVGGKGSGPGQFDLPDGITLRNDALYICDSGNDRIQILSCDLNFIHTFGSRGSGEGEFSFPTDIALDQEGNIYVVEYGNGRAQVFSPSGKFLRMISKLGSGPCGIHVDHNIVYITEWVTHRMSIFTTLGEFITSFGKGDKEGEFMTPRGITMDYDGFLYVCDTGNCRVQIF